MADANLTDIAGKAGLAGVTDRIGQLSRRRAGPLLLELDLTEGLAEEPPADPVSAVLGRHRARLGDVLDGLRRARDDDRVRGLLVRLGGRRLGLGLVQELRGAIAEFGQAGKLTVAWAETFGDFSAGNLPYYLATAFRRIVLQPSGDLGLTGIAVEQVFLRSAMDRLGVDYQVAKRREYKSAADMMTEHGFTGPAREATQRLAGSIAGQLTDAIAARLGTGTTEARELIDQGPFLAAEALELRLVDALGYRDEAYRWLRRRAGQGVTLQPLARYQRSHALASRLRTLPSPREPFVALVHATGPIRSGRSGRGPLSPGMGADTVAGALRAAAADERVRAILLRVNSPGGSYVASDTIWREVVRARARGKPVVVSMGNVAASGGYFIAMAADVIVAQPGTVTGSIGVITAKPVLSGLLDRAGISTDSVAEGAHATMYAPTRPFSEDEWEKVNSWLDRIYADFTGKVAAGRRLTPAHVEEVARGRVWTGADALDRRLVDELGGIETAADHARRRAGLPATAPVRVFPRPGPLDRLRPPGAGELAAGLAQSWLAGAGLADSWLTEAWGPVAAIAARGGFPPSGPLLLPGIWNIS